MLKEDAEDWWCTTHTYLGSFEKDNVVVRIWRNSEAGEYLSRSSADDITSALP